jgi:hypothetical protein
LIWILFVLGKGYTINPPLHIPGSKIVGNNMRQLLVGRVGFDLDIVYVGQRLSHKPTPTSYPCVKFLESHQPLQVDVMELLN